MNYFSHELEKSISGNELYLMRNKYRMYCPYSDNLRRCGTWCPMFELIVHYEDNPNTAISQAYVRTCNRQQGDIILNDVEVLEVEL